MDRFYILDCKDNIIGNPKGYRTHRGAMQQAGMPKAKAYRQAWQALEDARKINPSENLIHRIVRR